jgi:hypothetical protein
MPEKERRELDWEEEASQCRWDVCEADLGGFGGGKKKKKVLDNDSLQK